MKIMNKPFPQKCTISNDEYTVIGVVLLDPKYEGRAVIRFLNTVKSQYGVWHLIQKDYPFAYISNRLAVESSITFTVE